MNSIRTITRRSVLQVCAAAAVTAALIWVSGTVRAADPAKGAQRLSELTVIKTVADAEALKPGDMIAMACAKCKSVAVTYVEKKTAKATEPFLKVGEKHLCPGCNAMMEVVGVQKGTHTELKHVCKSCGDDSAYCCATRHGPGHTEGMEKH